MINKLKKISIIILPLILVVLVIYSTIFLVIGFSRDKGFNNFSPNYIAEKIKEIRKFENIKNIVYDRYVEDVDKDKLMNSAYEGFINALEDRYSSYFTKEELESYLMRRKGAFGGIGVSVKTDYENNTMTVIDFAKNSPAKEAGVKIGDKIVGADNVKIEDGINEIFNYIIGEVGTYLELKVYRKSIDENITYKIKREEIYRVNVRSKIYEDYIAYIQIYKFTKGVYEDFKKQFEDMNSENELKGLIIDLRGNGGGTLSDVLDIADYILPKEDIVYTMDKQGNKNVYKSDSEYLPLEIVVLIDSSSASASELLAGTIKDNKAGTIIGERSFGKGIVQTDYYLNDGSGIKITTKEYYMPSGTKIHERGIEPDYIVSVAEEYEKTNVENIPFEYDYPLNKAIEKLKEGME